MAAPAAQNGIASQWKTPNENSATSAPTSSQGRSTNSVPGTNNMKRIVLRAVILSTLFEAFH
jgi:hypothetical protein